MLKAQKLSFLPLLLCVANRQANTLEPELNLGRSGMSYMLHKWATKEPLFMAFDNKFFNIFYSIYYYIKPYITKLTTVRFQLQRSKNALPAIRALQGCTSTNCLFLFKYWQTHTSPNAPVIKHTLPSIHKAIMLTLGCTTPSLRPPASAELLWINTQKYGFNFSTGSC